MKKQAHYTIISDKIAIMLNNSENEHELVKGTIQNSDWTQL